MTNFFALFCANKIALNLSASSTNMLPNENTLKNCHFLNTILKYHALK